MRREGRGGGVGGDPQSISAIDGLQMSIKHLMYRGQTCGQEAAVQQTFHLERSSFFSLVALPYLAHSFTEHTPDPCPLEVSHAL